MEAGVALGRPYVLVGSCVEVLAQVMVAGGRVAAVPVVGVNRLLCR